ncbi:5-formyltetrahydrofolate cyclo-ligase [Brevundimonas sp.]|uniref:5-formyltetrahydrofolate cyclo-ligase n=1 Tax=Brevundimonas sp. TaxID=1871086 RepID=UPI002ABB9507|nr:5-formyltetrahydrofolate cyclo-ligase [Brevundimonas sp.]MDZ4362557.1 5-formyltetrahydrofolate cyclo-ligase [Brevundimonas sp.]
MTSDKTVLRAQMRALRRALTEADPAAARQLADHAASLPAGTEVAVYRAMGSEIEAEPLARMLLRQGRRLCLPVVMRRDEAMIFRRWTPDDPLEPDMAGCPAPLPLAEVVVPNLVILPLLAFDDTGARLGQGGGHYDRTLAQLRRNTAVLAIGLAYAGQCLDSLPIEAHDQGLDGILTETGYIPARKV